MEENLLEKEEGLKIMMLENIIKISEVSHSEELNREKTLIEQSTSLIIALSLLMTFLGIILPVALQVTDSKNLVFIGFSSSTMLLLASLICVILVQWRLKFKGTVDAISFLEEVQNNYENYTSKVDFYEVKIGNLGETTKSIKRNNDHRAKLIKASHILVFICVLVILQFSAIITIIESLK